MQNGRKKFYLVLLLALMALAATVARQATDMDTQPTETRASQAGTWEKETEGMTADSDVEGLYTVNGNIPYFTDSEKQQTTTFEDYAELDSLGRCGTAYALVGLETMPTEKRSGIGSVKPTGWHTVKYDGIEGNYLYNRCHLIGYQLTAENANRQNLITGTRYLNTTLMLPFENMVADYVKETENHVLYRVTPEFDGIELLARSVLVEAWSVEDNGEGVCFCVRLMNIQPGIVIDYATGDSTGPEYTSQ